MITYIDLLFVCYYRSDFAVPIVCTSSFVLDMSKGTLLVHLFNECSRLLPNNSAHCYVGSNR